MKLSVEERFWNKVFMCPMSGCWLWGGADNGAGYGRFNISGILVYAHRYSYELLRGAIPVGLVLDHLCRTPACVNPDHLRACTDFENLTAPGSLSKANKYNGITMCPIHEVPFSIRKDGRRRCRRCDVESVTAYKKEHRAAANEIARKSYHRRKGVSQ